MQANLLRGCGRDDDRCGRRAGFRWQVLPWALAVAVCLSRLYLGVHFPLDVAGAGLGMFIGGVLNLVFGVPSAAPASGRRNVLEIAKSTMITRLTV